MIRLNILTVRTWKDHGFIYPLRVFKPLLLREGIDVRVHYSDGRDLSECDVIGVLSDYCRSSRLHKNPPSRSALLERCRESGRRIIWFDMNDGTGLTSFQLLPLVDVYAKQSVLVDRERYTGPHYSARVFTDYYHRAEGISDGSREVRRRPAERRYLSKIVPSWNYGLGDYSSSWRAGWRRAVRLYWPHARYREARLVRPCSERSVDVSFRGNIVFNQPTIAYQREAMVDHLRDLSEATQHAVRWEGSLPYAKYLRELAASRVVVSPFGQGELCYRDFECFRAGAALLKPDLSHLETWPRYFKADETFVPHRWDFSDFKEKLNRLLADPEHRLNVASGGQTAYAESRSEAGGRRFAEHLRSILEMASTISTAHA